MSTPAVTVYINGDSAQLGQELTASSQAIRDFGAVSEEAGAATKFSMMEARGSVVLLGEEFGVHAPREISRMIAAVPGIGIALQNLLPIMGAVWAVGKIYEWAEAHRKATQDLTDEQKAAYEAATTGAEKFLKAQEASIKATYALAIAQASGDKIKQGQLRVEEAEALGRAQDDNMAKMQGELEHQKSIVAEEEKKAEAIRASQAERAKHPLGKGGAGGGLPATEDEDAKAQAARDNIDKLTALIEAASLKDLELQAQAITGTHTVSKEKMDAAEKAEKALEKEQETSKAYWEKDRANMQKDLADAQRAAEKERAEKERLAHEEFEATQAVGTEVKKMDDKAAAEKKKRLEQEEHEREKHNHKIIEMEKKKAEEMKHVEDRIAGDVSRTVAHSLFEAKSLGAGFEQVAKQMGEDMVQALIRWAIQELLSHTLMKKSAATLAGANMTASWAAAPWPIDAAAPSMGATAMAEAMAFEYGGEIPGAGPVPILGHGGETVVTKYLTDQIKNNVDRSGRGHTLQYAPVINAIDASGVERMLNKHSAVFMGHMKREFRRMNK
jgi:chemotaxis protein histidine kinase CheA